MANKDAERPSSVNVFRTLNWIRKHNFRPVPLHHQSKAALIRDYISLDYQPPSDDLWRRDNYGVGCVTGPAHKGPVDIDLDCIEAIKLAPFFLPHTPAIFGRKSKPRSHYIYRVDASAHDKKAFLDPVTKTCLLEIRADGGHQTVFPGSIHEDTGELIEWDTTNLDPEVPVIPADELAKACSRLAMACLVARHIWMAGNHNEPTKFLSGTLFRLEWTQDDVERLIEALMAFDGDTDKSRIPTVRNTYKKGLNGNKIAGSGVMRKHLQNDELCDRILEWAGNPTINLINEYNEKFGCCDFGGAFRIARTDVSPIRFYTKENWELLNATDFAVNEEGKLVPKIKLWINSPRRRMYDSVEFLPGQTETGSVLNLWTGWAVAPDPVPEGCKYWLELLRHVCGDDDTFRWALHWFADILRNPMHRNRTSLVIISKEQGLGKSLLFTYFGMILGVGTGYVSVSDEVYFRGRFNSHLSQCLLLHSEEALFAGNPAHASVIKSLITDPTRMYEPKFSNAVVVQNFLRLALTSNSERAATVQRGDRRNTVVDATGRAIRKELTDKVVQEMETTGPAALLHYLLNFPDYDRNLTATNLKNNASVNMAMANLEPIDEWWMTVLREGALLPDYAKGLGRVEKSKSKHWPDVVSSPTLYHLMVSHLRDRSARYVPDPTTFAMHLNNLTGVKLERSRRYFDIPVGDDDPRPLKQLSARHMAINNMPSLAEAREAFTKYMAQPIEWDPEDVDEPPPPQSHLRY